MGKRTATWAGDLQEVAVELQSGFGEAANDFFSGRREGPCPGQKTGKESKGGLSSRSIDLLHFDVTAGRILDHIECAVTRDSRRDLGPGFAV